MGAEIEILYNFHTTKYPSFHVFQPLKNVKTILSSQVIQKQATGWIWS